MGTGTYKILEVLDPEHEFSVIDNELGVLPIAGEILKDFHERIVNPAHASTQDSQKALWTIGPTSNPESGEQNVE